MPVVQVGTPTKIDNSFDLAVTVPAGADCLIVVTGAGDASSSDSLVSGVTYHGVAMTQIPLFSVYNNNWVRVQAWYLLAPDVGTFDVHVTFTGTVDQSGILAIPFSGVHQTVPFGTAVTASGGAGSGATPTVAISSTVGDLAFFAIMSDSATSEGGGLDPGGTEIIELNNIGNDTTLSAESYAGAATVTGTFTNLTAQGWSIGGVSIKPASGGGGGGGDLSAVLGEPVVGGSIF